MNLIRKHQNGKKIMKSNGKVLAKNKVDDKVHNKVHDDKFLDNVHNKVHKILRN